MGENYRDRVVDEVTAKVQQRPSIDQEEQLVRERAEQAVDGLIDEPVQTFTSLLAENQVVSELKGAASDGRD